VRNRYEAHDGSVGEVRAATEVDLLELQAACRQDRDCFVGEPNTPLGVEHPDALRILRMVTEAKRGAVCMPIATY
jgi:hypothetical protein